MTSSATCLSILCLLPLAQSMTGSGQSPTAPVIPAKQEFTLETEDGVKLAAAYYPLADQEENRPALILLHGGNRSKERWERTGIVTRLAEEKYHLLSIDIRGQGQSELGDLEALRAKPGLPVLDVQAALDWITKQPGIDPDRIALMGSSYGANLAAAGCLTRDWNVRTIVCFSATAVTFRFLQDFTERHEIPSGLYLATTEELERYDVVNTANRLAESTKGESRVEMYKGRSHAQALWEHFPESQEVVVSWLRSRFEE